MTRFRFGKPDPATEVDEELRFHLEMRTREYVARGLAAYEARRLAERRFGDVGRTREDCVTIDERVARRDGRREWFATLAQDVTFALRVLRRQWAPSLAAIACLAVGIGATTTMFSVADTLLVRALPYPTGDRLVLVGSTRRGRSESSQVSYLVWKDWRERQRSFMALAAVGQTDFTVRRTEPQRVTGALVSADLFRALGVTPEAGRAFTADDDRAGGPPVTIVSHGFAVKEFGSPRGALRQTITINGEPHAIVGVMADRSRYPSHAELWVPVGRDPLVGRTQRGYRNLTALGALRPGVTIDAARREMHAIDAELAAAHPDDDAGLTSTVAPLRETIVRGTTGPLGALSAAAALVLLVACANVAALQLARAAARGREIAVRAVLGAARTRLVRQLLTESVVLALAGAVTGCVLAYGARGLVARAVIGRAPAWMTFGVDQRALAFSLAVACVTGLAFGIAPALRLSRLRPALAQRGGGLGLSRTRLQRALVVGEVTIAVVLAAGAVLALASIRNLQRVPLGFDPTGVLTVRLSIQGGRYDDTAARARVVDAAVARLRELPRVAAVGAVGRAPLTGCCPHYGIHIEGHDGDDLPMIAGVPVTPGYSRAMGIALVAGRDFEARDGEDAPPVVLVNETFARQYFPGGRALGRHINMGGGPAEIVGVVHDVKQGSLVDAPEPQFYATYAMDPWSVVTLAVRARGGDAAALAPAVRGALREVAPDVPTFDVRTMDGVVRDATASARVLAALLGAFAAVALLLAATGVYALLSFFVAQRTRELGLRVALGAARSQVVRPIVRQSATLAAWGLGAGVLGALIESRWLAHVLYGVGPLQPLALVAACAACLGVAVAATYAPARRASASDPMVVLRSE